MSKPVFNARTADKFVVRLPDGMRKRIEDLANDNYTSMNTEIIRAIEAHLEGQARQTLLIDALEAKLKTEAQAAAKTGKKAAESNIDYIDGLKTGTR
ncbi:Arc family DNA-binding protein [Phytopseudomonas punonensis]|uniref:Arc-like DNA binding domain-containing protein n=1 Tax=Phytopseudomonas punonensis TaxID=1220495 RepID=A0A1M7J906_9GAMM|nr:Arc family DNA-binding protein [Pseudomonas punonensis]SHM48987.1 Arc-like DNA binding domain-containing protein [Pseudomonas punonensis]